MTDEELRRIAASIIVKSLDELKQQAERNNLSYLANLIGRALEEALEQGSHENGH